MDDDELLSRPSASVPYVWYWRRLFCFGRSDTGARQNRRRDLDPIFRVQGVDGSACPGGNKNLIRYCFLGPFSRKKFTDSGFGGEMMVWKWKQEVLITAATRTTRSTTNGDRDAMVPCDHLLPSCYLLNSRKSRPSARARAEQLWHWGPTSKLAAFFMHIGRQSAAQRLSIPQAQSRRFHHKHGRPRNALYVNTTGVIGSCSSTSRVSRVHGALKPQFWKICTAAHRVPMLRRPNSYRRCVVNKAKAEIKSARVHKGFVRALLIRSASQHSC
jgi:hypothetical protein